MKIIETERLYLRELKISDAEHFYALNANPEVLKYTGDRAFSTISEAEVFLKDYNEYKKNGFGRWAVIAKCSDNFLGWCGLKLNEEALIDLGFRFFQEHWGQGYATEAAQASLEFGFNTLNIDEIIGRADINNKASIRVLEKLNMSFWKNGCFDGAGKSVYYRIAKPYYDTGIKKETYI